MEVAAAGWSDLLGRHVGSLINAAAFVLVVFLVTWFGLRPLSTALLKPAMAGDGPSFEDMQRSLPGAELPPALPGVSNPLPGVSNPLPGVPFGSPLNMPSIDDFESRIKPAPQERLERMVDINEERTAMILRKWANKEAA
jgi:flagellar M-ring protein FliF